jgi:hypothetical protein
MDSSRPRDPVGTSDGDVPVWNSQTQAWEPRPQSDLSVSGDGDGGSTVSAVYGSPGASDSLAKAPLPADRAVHPDSDDAIEALLAQVAHDGTPLAAGAEAPPVFAISNFSGATWFIDELDPVPSLKRVKVYYDPGGGAGAEMRAIGDAGIPFPDGFEDELQIDSDGAVFGYHKGEVRGPGLKGVAYSFFSCRRATPEEQAEDYTYACWTLSRVVGADDWDGVMRERLPAGYTFGQPWTDIYARDGATEAEGYGQETGILTRGWWGTFATGETPHGMNLLPTPDDLWRGHAEQPFRVLVANCAPSTVGPARRDRGDGTLDPSYPLVEGMLLTIDQSEPVPATLSAPHKWLFRSFQMAGGKITDKTAGVNACVVVSLNKACLPYFVADSPLGGDWSSTSLVGFPWHLLRVMVPATETDFQPRTLPATTGFDFASIPGLFRWHDADDLIVDDFVYGDRATRWIDRCGYRHLEARSRPSAPRFVEDAVAAGEAGLVFDGIRSFMVFDSANLETVAQPATVVIVGKFDAAALDAAEYSIIFDSGHYFDNRLFGLFRSTSELRMVATSEVQSAKNVTGNRDVLIFQLNGASSWIRLNGSQSSNLNPGTAGLRGFSLGAHAATGFADGFLAAALSKVAVYGRTLTSDEIAAIEAGV